MFICWTCTAALLGTVFLHSLHIFNLILEFVSSHFATAPSISFGYLFFQNLLFLSWSRLYIPLLYPGFKKKIFGDLNIYHFV